MTFHIVPVDDTKPHTESAMCDCNPRMTRDKFALYFIHNSWNCRELAEPDFTPIDKDASEN